MADPHIILTGPQRCGKSLMLEIFTRYGLETGFKVKDFEGNGVNEFFEFPLWGEHYHRKPPYIIKHARLASSLEDRTKVFDWRIDHVLIFVRHFDLAVKDAVALDRGGDYQSIKRRYFDRLGKIFYQCIENDWPYTVVKYPTFQDNYSYFVKLMLGANLWTANFGDFHKRWESAWRKSVERRGISDAS